MRVTARGPATVPGSNSPAATAVTAEHPAAIAGRLLVRYGLAVVIAWIGALKYTATKPPASSP